MTISAADYTASELLAVVSARLLCDGQVVFAGVGIPLLAATLAQRLHAPGLTILFEGGTVKCWGSNAGGQIGDNSTTDRWMPVTQFPKRSIWIMLDSMEEGET